MKKLSASESADELESANGLDKFDRNHQQLLDTDLRAVNHCNYLHAAVYPTTAAEVVIVTGRNYDASASSVLKICVQCRKKIPAEVNNDRRS